MGKERFLKIDKLSKSFVGSNAGWGKNGKNFVAMDNVSFDVFKGEILGLIGETASGKTTLGRCLVRLIGADSGQVEHNGKNLLKLSAREFRKYRSKFQMIFQNPALALNPLHTVEKTLAEPLTLIRHYSGPQLQSQIAELLNSVGLELNVLSRHPNQLSGGQKQRVAIARALAVKPQLLIADEPTASLDASLKYQVLDLLQALRNKFCITVIIITHDISLVKKITDRIAVMYKGRLVEIGPAATVINYSEHPYTQNLIQASELQMDADHGRRKTRMPASSVEAGCSYLALCPIARERCARENIRLQEIGPGHSVACFYAGMHNACNAAVADLSLHENNDGPIQI